MRASLLAVAKFIYNYYVFTVVYSIIRPSDDSEALKIVEIKKLSPHRESIRCLINVAGRFSVFCFCFCFCFFFISVGSFLCSCLYMYFYKNEWFLYYHPNKLSPLNSPTSRTLVIPASELK